MVFLTPAAQGSARGQRAGHGHAVRGLPRPLFAKALQCALLREVPLHLEGWPVSQEMAHSPPEWDTDNHFVQRRAYLLLWAILDPLVNNLYPSTKEYQQVYTS